MATRTSLPILEFATLLVVILGCVIAVVPGADEYAINLFASQKTSETMEQVVDNEVPVADQQLADGQGFPNQSFEQPIGELENSVVADAEPSTMTGQFDSPMNEEYDLQAELSELPDSSGASDSSEWELDFHPEVEEVANAPIEVEQLPAIDEFAVNNMNSENVSELSIMKSSETTEVATDDDEFMQELLDEPSSGSETEFVGEFNEEFSQAAQVADRTKTRSRAEPSPAPVPFHIVPDQARSGTANGEVVASIPWESSEERTFVATDVASGRNEPPRQFAGREQANLSARPSNVPANTVSGPSSFRSADDENSNWTSNPAYQRWMRESSLRDRGRLPGEQSWERVYNEFIDNPDLKSSEAKSPAFKPVGFSPAQVQNDHFVSQWRKMELESYARQNAGSPPPMPGPPSPYSSASFSANANSRGEMPRVFSPVQNGSGNERVIRRPMSANSMRQNGEFRRNR